MFIGYTMGLTSSPGFLQHRMERVFEQYLWEFVLLYIDDIILFGETLEDLLIYLPRQSPLLILKGGRYSFPTDVSVWLSFDTEPRPPRSTAGFEHSSSKDRSHPSNAVLSDRSATRICGGSFQFLPQVRTAICGNVHVP